MSAKIYQPARNVMQSGQAKSKIWILEFVPAEARSIDPLMGWTSSGDMNSQVKLTFSSKSAALEYADIHGIEAALCLPQKRKHNIRSSGYAENFATKRRTVWTH
jgi:NADH dehydrogenase